MSSVINVNSMSYTEETTVDNWAAEYAKRAIEEHKGEIVLDHPDGSVTREKLSADVINDIKCAQQTADSAVTVGKRVESDLKRTTEVADNAYNDAKSVGADLSAHKADTVSHVTQADRDKWDNGYIYGVNSEEHANDKTIHVTESERTAWNAKADKSYVDEITGDIDSALDGIISIQNSLIGGDSV